MKDSRPARRARLWTAFLCLLAPLLLFIALLSVRIPPSASRPFSSYSFIFFIFVFALYYFCFRSSGIAALVGGLVLTALLFGLPLAYKWASGFSDNFVIGGLLPYKDAKNYYYGANLILKGLPLDKAGQATERPLYAGFVSVILLLVQQDFKLALAIMTGLAGASFYVSARALRASLGAIAAGLYAALSYFYFQPLIGYNMSELLGFALGCLALALLSHAALNPNYPELLVGLACLVVAVSARAGTFLIFPLLALWSGYLMRGSRSYSFGAALIGLLVLGGTFLVADLLVPRLLGVPAGSAFGNFSYAIYGQVHGGTGWHSAIDDLGTREPAMVYQAAWQFFLVHPLSFFIGAAKSYGEFFLPGDLSVFAFPLHGDLPSLLSWAAVVLLMLAALVRIARTLRSHVSSLLLAAFAGILLSIPFLPPIDGGARFYASTVPFLFALPGFAISRGATLTESGLNLPAPDQALLYLTAGGLVAIVVTPMLIRILARPLAVDTPACSAGQQAFVAEFPRDSYIDVVPGGQAECGLAPRVCLSDFRSNGAGDQLDDFFVELMSLVRSSASGLRLVPSINLLDSSFHYFAVTDPALQGLQASSPHLLSGCAVEIHTQNQSILQVESMSLLSR